MFGIDLAMTLWVNGLAARWATLDAVGIFCATGLLVVLGVVVVACVVHARNRRVLIGWVATIVIAYALSQLIGVLAFRERPFVRHPNIHQIVAKAATSKSFPSDHATLAFAAVLPVLAVLPRTRRGAWGRAALLCAAAAIAIGRVYVGVHYVSDVLAGALLAYLVWLAIHAVMECPYPVAASVS